MQRVIVLTVFKLTMTDLYLPPANEVWGKVFLHLSVILFTVATEAGGTHHTGIHTCVMRYASYWNAYLCESNFCFPFVEANNIVAEIMLPLQLMDSP